MNFYQSDLRRYINEAIYQKPLFEVDILGTSYFGIIKTQQKLGKPLNRYMVHGVALGDMQYYNEDIMQTVERLRRDFAKQWGDIFFQLGSLDVVDTSSTNSVKDIEVAKDLAQKKIYTRSQLRERYSLQPSWREHMPDTTIVLDLTKTLAELKSDFSSSGKRYYNKAKKQQLSFSQAKPAEREQFREVRYTMAYDKGFTTISKDSFLTLMQYLTETKQGTLVLAKKEGAIVCGSVLLFLDDQLIYLYGATDRSYGNIGAHYWLMYETMRWGHKHQFTTLDLLGVAPPGSEKGHYLQGVTRFKQAFGGTTISYVGNYDIVFNKMLYKTAKVMKR